MDVSRCIHSMHAHMSRRQCGQSIKKKGKKTLGSEFQGCTKHMPTILIALAQNTNLDSHPCTLHPTPISFIFILCNFFFKGTFDSWWGGAGLRNSH